MAPFESASLRPFGLRLDVPNAGLDSISATLIDALARRDKLVLLRGAAETSREDFLRWCGSFPNRELLHWDCGPVMEMRETPEAKNYLFSREAVPFHWDGAFHRVPSYLMFHCVEAPPPGAGGETLFCDTQRVWNEASRAEQTLFSRVTLTYKTQKLAHYGGVVTGPLVQRHPDSGATILRFAEPVETALNPVSLEISGASEQECADCLEFMRRRIYDPGCCYRHEWRRGDVLIADNHALIHGRTAFARDCPRHLRRIQLL